MINLSLTTDKLQAVLAGNVAAKQLQCFASWRSMTATAHTRDRNLINTNNTTDIDLVGSPSSGETRVIEFLSIYNNDTANATLTIKYDANGTEVVLHKATLAPGERLEYQEGEGFATFSNSGAVKSSVNQGNNVFSSNMTAVVLGSDQTNNNGTANTIANVTGLSFPVSNGGTYYFKFFIWYTSAATTTGSRWSITGPTNSLLGYRQSWNLGAVGTAGTDVFTDHPAGAYDTPSASNASSATATAGQANIAIIEGMITVTADGDVTARFASEVSSSAIVAKAGSVVYYHRVV